jgi:short-subunit dehydrogenase
MNELRGKTAIVTGASAGIGEAIAIKFVEEGANCVLIARNRGPLEKAAAQMDQQRAAVYPMNVMDYPAFEKMLGDVKKRWGTIDFLINNAGCINRGQVAQVAPEALAEIVQVNLIAPIVLTRLTLEIFKQQQHGMIINIASLAGRTPTEGASTYSCSKFGLRAFSYGLAEELRQTYPDIKCCLVSPGPTVTRFLLEEIDKVPDISLSQKWVMPDVVAEVVFKTAMDAKMERITGGALTGIMTHGGYLFPGIKRLTRSINEAKGRKNREELKKYRDKVIARYGISHKLDQ